MRIVLLSLSSALAQPAYHAVAEAGANLPSRPVGKNDLIAVNVQLMLPRPRRCIP